MNLWFDKEAYINRSCFNAYAIRNFSVAILLLPNVNLLFLLKYLTQTLARYKFTYYFGIALRF